MVDLAPLESKTLSQNPLAYPLVVLLSLLSIELIIKGVGACALDRLQI